MIGNQNLPARVLFVGDPVRLDDLFGKRLDESVLQEATERFRAGMQATLDKLDIWVAEKGYKREKRALKRENKALSAQYRSAEKCRRRFLFWTATF